MPTMPAYLPKCHMCSSREARLRSDGQAECLKCHAVRPGPRQKWVPAPQQEEHYVSAAQ